MTDFSHFQHSDLLKLRPIVEDKKELTEGEKARMLCEHLWPGHRYPEGGNLETNQGPYTDSNNFQPSPSIAVIKNDSGVDTGDGINAPGKQVVLAYRNSVPEKNDVEYSLVSHWLHPHTGKQHEDWVHGLSKKQIAHLARHAGLTVSGDEE